MILRKKTQTRPMKFMSITFLLVNLIRTAVLNQDITTGQPNNAIHAETHVNDKIQTGGDPTRAQGTHSLQESENAIHSNFLQSQSNAAAPLVNYTFPKIVVAGVREAKDEELMDLLDKTIKKGKFSQEGDILDLLILLYKSLETAQLSNEKHRQILKDLGEVLAKGYPKNAYYKNTLRLLGEAIRHDKILENDLQETLRFVGKVVEKNTYTDEEAAEILIAMLIHNLKLGPHHYKRLGLEADQPKNKPLQKHEDKSQHKIESPKKCLKCKLYKTCKTCKICKKHRGGKKQRKKRAVGPELSTSENKDALPTSGSPEANSNMMMGDDPNTYIEYNNPEDVIIQPIIENQKAINSLNNTRPPTSNVNSNIDNNNKLHFENNSSHDDLNLKQGNRISNQISTRYNSGNLRTGFIAGNKVQGHKSKDGDVKPQTITDKPHVIRSPNRIILTFNVGRS
ncbi:hypothetical protein NBO_65g0016 [Nosema bombycis CQ1]|uniref:Uncharacterized protein n=1 Tax=Nosema bombycis (strain CQ1 / CVCC 102059) TaxID=578461 RepID=R0KTQ0_NOSB1|nr:hypothetical protein NBO_65g0016 [Nosema bombycis CQ1]|eukprot:EOB13612.1 hypothetical protein NBO_65g0016 [Nosema bombycis CQ1]